MPLILACFALLLATSCAHEGGQKPKTSLSEDHPGYYEPDMHRKYHDKRYENDESFEKYYDWKGKK